MGTDEGSLHYILLDQQLLQELRLRVRYEAGVELDLRTRSTVKQSVNNIQSRLCISLVTCLKVLSSKEKKSL